MDKYFLRPGIEQLPCTRHYLTQNPATDTKHLKQCTNNFNLFIPHNNLIRPINLYFKGKERTLLEGSRILSQNQACPIPDFLFLTTGLHYLPVSDNKTSEAAFLLSRIS